MTGDNLVVALKIVPDNNTPRYDGLFTKFYKTFWEHRKYVLINSLKQAKIEGSLNISE